LTRALVFTRTSWLSTQFRVPRFQFHIGFVRQFWAKETLQRGHLALDFERSLAMLANSHRFVASRVEGKSKASCLRLNRRREFAFAAAYSSYFDTDRLVGRLSRSIAIDTIACSLTEVDPLFSSSSRFGIGFSSITPAPQLSAAPALASPAVLDQSSPAAGGLFHCSVCSVHTMMMRLCSSTPLASRISEGSRTEGRRTAAVGDCGGFFRSVCSCIVARLGAAELRSLFPLSLSLPRPPLSTSCLLPSRI
jgi:hypothetical protein